MSAVTSVGGRVHRLMKLARITIFLLEKSAGGWRYVPSTSSLSPCRNLPGGWRDQGSAFRAGREPGSGMGGATRSAGALISRCED